MSSRNWLFGLILIVATTLAYQPAWNGKPIWDDEIHITIPALRSVHGLARIWTDPAAAPQYYPLLHTVFWIEYRLCGAWPLPYHLVNIALHALTAVLMLRILQRLELPGAWVAAAIFALHPVLVESVAWISELKNTLSGALCAGSALMYLKYDQSRERSAYFIAFVLFLAGLMTKTVIVTLPAVLLVIFWWKRGTLAWTRDLKPLAPFFLVALGAGLVTIWVEQKFCADHFQYLATIAVIAPFSAGARWIGGRLQAGLRSAAYLAVGALLLFLASMTWAQSRTYRDAETCFHAVVAKNPNSPTAHSNLGIAMVKKGALNDAIAHYETALELAPNYEFGHYNLGIALLRKGEVDGAIAHLRTVLGTNPNHSKAYYSLAMALAQKGETNQAIAYYDRALKLEPDFPDAHCNLANLLLEKGEIDAALAHYRTALQLQPDNPGAHYNLAVGLVHKGEPDAAIAELRIALQLDPAYPDAEPLLRDLLSRKKQP